MKIASIKTTPLALAFKEPCHGAGRVDHTAAVVLVEVETDDGLIGIGESVAADQTVFTPSDVYEICRQRAADLYEHNECYHHS